MVKCLIPSCLGNDELQKFKFKGFSKLLTCSKKKGDGFQETLQNILKNDGENATTDCHKSCYCSYTSPQHIERELIKKENDGCC